MSELAAAIERNKDQGGGTLCVAEPADDVGVGQWAVCSPAPTERGPASYGPIRQVVEHEFVIVHGEGNVVNQRHAVRSQFILWTRADSEVLLCARTLV